jgi:hypothetical protein
MGLGLQHYLGSGQVPAAMTTQVVDAIIALCLLLNKIYQRHRLYKHYKQQTLDELYRKQATHVRGTGK